MLTARLVWYGMILWFEDCFTPQGELSSELQIVYGGSIDYRLQRHIECGVKNLMWG